MGYPALANWIAANLVTEQYPEIKVTPQISGWSDYWTRLPVLASSGQIGDIVAMQSMRMPSFYSVLEPLDPMFAKDSFDKSDIARICRRTDCDDRTKRYDMTTILSDSEQKHRYISNGPWMLPYGASDKSVLAFHNDVAP